MALLLLLFTRPAEDVQICVKFPYLQNLVNSALRDMCDTSMKSCDQRLHFVYLHLRPLSKLWGRHDPKTENKEDFCL